MSLDLSLERIRESVKQKNYLFFESGEYNLNLVGVRTADKTANTFNDFFSCSYFDGFNWVSHVWAITTDPGVYYRENPINANGTAILVPGQHRGLFKMGKHKGKYPALVQSAPCRVYRDNNKDAILDCNPGSIESGNFGINCHDSNKTGHSKQVDKWSAGCQVFSNHWDHKLLLALAARAVYQWGDGFTYTLLLEEELV